MTLSDKLIATLLAFLVSVGIGWHAHAIWDGYMAQKAEKKAIASLGNGEANIIKFNTAANKEKAIVKDDCIAKPIPPSLSKLLK